MLVLALVITGGIAAFDAFRLAVREEYRQRYGATTTGVIVSRITNNAEGATGERTSSSGQVPTGPLRLDRAMARWIRTRSTDVWWIGFEYPSGGTLRRGGDTVSREKWESFQPGQQVAVRFDPSRQDYERAALEGESDLPDALAQAAFGTAMIGLAGAVVRFMRPKKASRRMATPALVTDVTPVSRGAARWRVEFTFLDDEGTKYECAQEFLRDIWQPGHEGIAEYEPDRPDEAVIIPVPTLMARGPATPAAAPSPAVHVPSNTTDVHETEPFGRRIAPALAWAGVWALVLGATGFIASIAGWTLYYPASPQGPIHALFIAAPGGAVAGAFLGGFIRVLRAHWSWAQMCVALVAAVAIYTASLIDGWQRFAAG